MQVRELDRESCMIQFPFRDPSSDFIQILVVKNANELILSDYGSSISYLRDSGLTISDKRLNSVIRSVKNKSGAKIINNEMILEVEDPSLLNIALIDLLHGIQEVKSNVNLVRSRNPFKSNFKSEVINTIIGEWELNPLVDQTFVGVTGKTYTIDLVFPEHELYLDTVTAAGRSMGSQRLMKLLGKVVEFKKKFINGHSIYVGLDDRDEKYDIWPTYNIELLQIAGAVTFYWEDQIEVFTEKLEINPMKSFK